MRSIAALTRASFLSAASYRLGMVISIAALLASFVPVYFVADALQPMVAESIRNEAGQYFGFLVVGMCAVSLMTTAVSAIPGALSGSISSGTMEALLVTRTPLSQVLIGLVGYGLLWSGLRAGILIVGASIVGVPVVWGAVPAVLAVATLLVAAYFAVGLVAAALVLVFRTSGPLTTAVIAVSGLLGGVYYSTTVIPSWLQDLSALVPLTYALRAARMLLLKGASLPEVSQDIAILTGQSALLLVVSVALFASALRYARSAGTLSQY
jgi:ABC-2 type transport system permease protein